MCVFAGASYTSELQKSARCRKDLRGHVNYTLVTLWSSFVNMPSKLLPSIAAEYCNDVCCLEVSVCPHTLVDPQSSQTVGMIHVCYLSWPLWRFSVKSRVVVAQRLLAHRGSLMAKYFVPCFVFVCMCRLCTLIITGTCLDLRMLCLTSWQYYASLTTNFGTVRCIRCDLMVYFRNWCTGWDYCNC